MSDGYIRFCLIINVFLSILMLFNILEMSIAFFVLSLTVSISTILSPWVYTQKEMDTNK